MDGGLPDFTPASQAVADRSTKVHKSMQSFEVLNFSIFLSNGFFLWKAYESIFSTPILMYSVVFFWVAKLKYDY